MAIEIVPYGAQWTDAILQLQTHLWSPDVDLNRSYFGWKYLDNPYLQPPRLQLALVGRELIGMRGFWGARWRAGGSGETYDAPCAGDLVVEPSHRSGRVVQRILAAGAADLVSGGLPVALNFSAGARTQLASLLSGWRSAGGLEVAARGAEPPPPPRRDSAGAGVELGIETACRSAEMAGLASEVSRDGRIRHVRDAEWFAWRYRNPLSHYRFVYAWRERSESSGGRRLAGFAVLQGHRRRKPGRMHVADWEAEGPAVFGILLEAALRAGGFEEVTLWATSLADGARRRLAELGFGFVKPAPSLGRALRAGQTRSAVLVRQPGDPARSPAPCFGERPLLDLASWDLRGIYSDHY